MHSVLKQIGEIGIIPVIKIDDADKAVPLAAALAAGGIPCVELTFRTEQANKALERIAVQMPDILLGAGTVLTTEQVDKAADCGARFLVSPGFNPRVVDYALKKGLLITPGCATPSDVERAMEAGLSVVKFFPAEQAGGLEYIKALAGPYGGVRFIPTGGINAGNIGKYAACPQVLACGGSWMAPPQLIAAADWEAIAAHCREAVALCLQAGAARPCGKQ
jgi:2-dehydro-3-deoxyphosphogluconate aldolase/(4S)-4-hydroxy-2-oxoglutarate aldolase